jgi:hypothetical protein
LRFRRPASVRSRTGSTSSRRGSRKPSSATPAGVRVHADAVRRRCVPVEAIHLSAFLDSLQAAQPPAQFARGELRELGRLGALVIDFPYFDRFPVGVVRYLLKQPTARSAWGDALHKTTPVALAHTLLARVRRLRAEASTRSQAERVLALALGYVSHLAVDRTLHPFVNRQARARVVSHGGDPAHQHTEVEKFHSVLFHEERLGFDFMGRPELRRHIEVDAHAIHRDPALREALQAGFDAALARTPTRGELERWARGYRQYVWLVSGPAGKLLVPERVKDAVRPEVYRGGWGSFDARYRDAVACSVRAIDAALALAECERSHAAFERVLPEGPIDLD